MDDNLKFLDAHLIKSIHPNPKLQFLSFFSSFLCDKVDRSSKKILTLQIKYKNINKKNFLHYQLDANNWEKRGKKKKKKKKKGKRTKKNKTKKWRTFFFSKKKNLFAGFFFINIFYILSRGGSPKILIPIPRASLIDFKKT